MPLFGSLNATICVLALSSAPAAPDSVQRVIARTRLFYESCHTFQADVVLGSASEGKSSHTIHVECEVGAHGIMLRSLVETTADNMPPGVGLPLTHTIDDGKWVYQIDDAAKTYFRMARVPESIFGLFAGLMNKFLESPTATITTTGPKGDEIYLLTAKAPGITAQMRLSKLTGAFLSAHSIIQSNGRSSVEDMAVRNQLFDKPIPAGALVWTPPAGYKAVQPSGGERSP